MLSKIGSSSTISTLDISQSEIKPKTIESLSYAIIYQIQEVISDYQNYPQFQKYEEDPERLNPFNRYKTPSIEIGSYLKRIVKYSYLEESTLIISLIYLDRYCEVTKLILSNENIYWLLLISILQALKYNEDENFSDAQYAKIGGVSLEELKELEVEFLLGIQFTLFIDEDDFRSYDVYLSKFDDMM